MFLFALYFIIIWNVNSDFQKLLLYMRLWWKIYAQDDENNIFPDTK